MSRCYPYPPPGYEKKAAQPVAEIIPAPQAPRKEKHKHREKDKDKKKKRKRDEDAKDDNAHKEKRSSKNQKAAPVNDVVGAAVHPAENGRISEPNAAGAPGDRKPAEGAQVVVEKREGNGGGISLQQEGRSLQDARIVSSSERDAAGKPGSRVSVSSTGGRPSSSGSSGRGGEAQEHHRAGKPGRDGALDAKASLSRTGLEAKTSRDAKASSSFDAARAATVPRSGSGREEAKASASVSRNDVRSSGYGGLDAKASVARDDVCPGAQPSVSRNDVRSSDAPASVSRVEPQARSSVVSPAGKDAAHEAKASVSRINDAAAKSEARKHEKSSKKREKSDKASSSKSLEKEINGKVSPLLIPAKPLDTGQTEQQQQQQQHQHQPVQPQAEGLQQQQQQQQAHKETERVPEPKLKRLKLAEVAAEPNYGEDYLGWLVSDKKKKPASVSGEEKGLVEQQQQRQVWAEAIYLPAVDLYALPYVVPD